MDNEESDEKYLKKNEMMAMQQKPTQKTKQVWAPNTRAQYYRKNQTTLREQWRQKRKTSKIQKNKNYFNVKLCSIIGNVIKYTATTPSNNQAKIGVLFFILNHDAVNNNKANRHNEIKL